MCSLPLSANDNLLLGMESAADACIIKISDDIAIVQSLDFFTPVVDDPFEFGQIAAANSLSDIYAVGARPLCAMNIVCFPLKEQPGQILKEILRGGVEKIHEAGALLAGGHSVEDKEPKYGLSVTGIVHPEKFFSNRGARPGDVLVLTKPIGTGILATAHKAGLLPDDSLKRLINVMKQLNKVASEAMKEAGAHAATDITGFGLAGHALEMALASKCRIEIETARVPIFKEALEFIKMGMIPEGDYSNKNYCKRLVTISKDIDPDRLVLMFDAQTSGGLLISIHPQKLDILKRHLEEHGQDFGVIGRVKEGEPGVDISP